MTDLEKAVSAALSAATGGQAATTLAEAVKATVPAGVSGLGEGVMTLTEQVSLLRQIAEQQAEAAAENTLALAANTTSQKGGALASVTRDIANTATKALGGGLTLLPLVTSLVELFRGKKQATTTALETYAAPASIDFVGATPQTAGAPIGAIDYGQDGMPRLVQTQTLPNRAKTDGAYETSQEDLEWPSPVTTLVKSRSGQPDKAAARESAQITTTAWAPSITVQVNTIDSRSFLDHSDAIAQAVRQAILNAHPLGELVSEM